MVGSKPRFFIQRLLCLAHFILYYVFRLQGKKGSLLDKNDENMEFEVVEDDLSGFRHDSDEEEEESEEFRHDSDEEEEESEVYLKFKFPTFEEFRQNLKEKAVDDLPVEEIDDANGDLSEICGESSRKGVSEEEIAQEFNVESIISSDSIDFGEGLSYSDSDGFLTDMDFNKNPDFGDEESDADLETLEQSVELEHDSQVFASDFLSEQDFDDEHSDNIDDDDFGMRESDEDDEDDADSLWEEQELMEQLKMELRKVRASGLPTILEESEASPKILMDDLKPWKMDEFQRQDCITELHKFYKTYRERMRKFDIISYQKMYAMGCLQLKDPLQSIPKQKSSSAAFKSLLPQNLWLSKNKIHGADPMNKFIKEVQDDIESVYVAHTCLSWEFLQWQYEKALDLWDADPEGHRRYNEVAGEFQRFQVLLHRFIENEPFQGPRTQNYINTRRNVHGNLLRVPVIRQDNKKDKRQGRKYVDEHAYVVTSEVLVEILEESIRTFWQFVRADKDCATTRNQRKRLPEVACPEDNKLLMEAKKLLQKKEMKLRDVVRSRNCILKKCRRGDEYDRVLCFFSQVDLRLVARTLNMSRITREQLMWCLDKLNRICFVDRQIQVERAFLLFPC